MIIDANSSPQPAASPLAVSICEPDSSSDTSSAQSDLVESVTESQKRTYLDVTDDNEITDDEETRKKNYYDNFVAPHLTKKKKTGRKRAETRRLITYQRYKKAVVDYMNYSGDSQHEVIDVFCNDVIRRPCELSKWTSDVTKQVIRKPERINLLHRLVYQEYIRRRGAFQQVSGDDLMKFAYDVAKENKITFAGKPFEASFGWLHRFKKRHRIVSRKTTKFVTKHHVRNSHEMNLKKTNFRQLVREKLPLFQPENVYNADESGYQYEFVDKRTLETIGTSDVIGKIEQKNMIRRSYTIMPTISAAGELLPRLLVVLNERTGKIGKNVFNGGFFTSPNLLIATGKAGKTSSLIVNLWFEKAFLPMTGARSLLLLDASTTRKERELLKLLEASGVDKKVEFEQVPGGTTGELQPCDQYLFLAWKRYVKVMQRSIRAYRKDFRVYERQNVLRIQAWTHNQLSAKSWRPAILSSWEKCGYLERDKADLYPNAMEWAFRDTVVGFRRESTCEIDGCSAKTFVRCLRCKRCLCLDHCFWEKKLNGKTAKYLHYHDQNSVLLGDEQFDAIRPDEEEILRFVSKKDDDGEKAETGKVGARKTRKGVKTTKKGRKMGKVAKKKAKAPRKVKKATKLVQIGD